MTCAKQELAYITEYERSVIYRDEKCCKGRSCSDENLLKEDCLNRFNNSSRIIMIATISMIKINKVQTFSTESQSASITQLSDTRKSNSNRSEFVALMLTLCFNS